METQNNNSHFIERILHLMRLLEENHIDIDQVLDGNMPPVQFSAEDREIVQTAMEYISL